MIEALKLLKQYYGYNQFKNGQKEIIENILNGKDCLGIMPTGAGKSICYQIPSLILNGITIVISPLISLMKDQVDNLKSIGINATYINSTLSSSKYRTVLEGIRKNQYKILYIAPERLEANGFISFLNSISVSMIAIDEAHCISRWGHDFRKSYLRIPDVIKSLNNRPVIAAFTATATDDVRKDIENLLELNDPFILTTGFDRENLYFSVESPQSKKEFLENYLNEHRDESGIIYCATRKNVEDLYAKLNYMGFNTLRYHGGMLDKQRADSQDDFLYDRARIMVATNAFGMGINKPNIRYVIHYNMPKDMESYYQEAGRAGRDGEEAECILLFSRSDVVTNQYLIEGSHIETDSSNDYKKLRDMIAYCSTDKCLRKFILQYFGEKVDYDICHKCKNCNSTIEEKDITIEAQKIMSCIARMGERFGINLVADVLKGAKSHKIRENNFQKLKTYGIMSNYSKSEIKDLIYYLISEQYMKAEGDKYPILTLCPVAKKVLFENEKVKFRKKIEKMPIKKMFSINKELFEHLKNVRKQISLEENLAPFIILSDTTLKDMCIKMPKNEEQMLEVTGIGIKKYEKYGEKFLKSINEFKILSDEVIDCEIQGKKNRPNLLSGEDSLQKTCELFLSGATIKEIIQKRQLARSTIETHLLRAYEKGRIKDLEPIIQTEYKEEIIKAIKNNKTDKLKPIKESLPKEVGYLDIKYYIIQLAKEEVSKND